jgi:hypothetical protein
VTSRPFYDPAKLWRDKLYRWRVRIQPTSQAGSAGALELRRKLEVIEDPSVWEPTSSAR